MVEILQDEAMPMIVSTLRVSTPLIFAALGGFFAERSGIINIALEGMILVGALAAAAIAHYTQSAWIGAAGAMLVGSLFAAFYGFFVIRLRSDQIIAGVAMNLFAAGLTPFICNILFGSTGASPALPVAARFDWAPLVLVWVFVLLIHFWRSYSVGGLWHRIAGEKPEALRAAGISVTKTRWISVLASGAMAALGGACLSIFLSSSFSRNMSAGRGFIALAALILGNWRPLPAAGACLLFGFTEALQIRLQGVEFSNGVVVPTQFIYMIPYVVTIIVLAGALGISRAPAALGKPFSEWSLQHGDASKSHLSL